MAESIDTRLGTMQASWAGYVAKGDIEQLVEFAIIINSLAEFFNRLHFSGLTRLCEGLENTVLDLLDHHDAGLSAENKLLLQRQVDTLIAAATSFQPSHVAARREAQALDSAATVVLHEDWLKPRLLHVVADAAQVKMTTTLVEQLQLFGFNVLVSAWEDRLLNQETPLAVVFIPKEKQANDAEVDLIQLVRAKWRTSQLVCVADQELIEPIVSLMRAGIDISIPVEEQSMRVLNCILDFVQVQAQEKSRVLIVEDSKVAITMIQRTLMQHGIESEAIVDPGGLFAALQAYQPDLILMDMHMPRFNGVEATRVLRQMDAYKAVPIVYLSGESGVGMQVEALRLGGDQFLIKPINPVLLAAVVKTKIERFREAQRSSTIDGLTGLLNHTASKSRLKSMVSKLNATTSLSVVMLDIDHFKSINDTYGHPVGDQVIQSLAWLLKGHLRANDLVGRYGGEEFMIAMQDVTQTQAQAIVDRIRQLFSALPHSHSNGALFATFSAGIASYGDIKDASVLTEHADFALLNAKRLGRNCVSLSNNASNLKVSSNQTVLVSEVG